MGGRRGKFIRDILGPGNRSLKTKLTKAVNEENPEKIAYYSSKLMSKSKPSYKRNLGTTVEFMNTIAERADEFKHLDGEERRERVTKIWTKLKKEKKLKLEHPYVDEIVVNSALEALKGEQEGGARK